MEWFLVIFTTMAPYAEPKFTSIQQPSEVVCERMKDRLERTLGKVENLVINLECELRTVKS